MEEENKYDLAFIIPCHNLEDYICILLDSFLRVNQENIFLSIEYIFVLDSCTDNTKMKIENRMKGLPYKIFSCSFGDPGLARNVGIENSNSEYIWFVDGDDWLLQTDFLYPLLSYMRQEKLPIVKVKYYSNYTYFIDHELGTVWQYIINRDFLGDLRFGPVDENGGGEDGRFIDALLKSGGYTFTTVPYLADEYYYYYNYFRYGSIISTVLNFYNK